MGAAPDPGERSGLSWAHGVREGRQRGVINLENRFAAQVETAVFDPWSTLMDHRPLGNVMRVRKVVYYASGKTRGAL